MGGRGLGDADRDARVVWGTVIVVTLLGCLVAWQFVAPAPPQTLVLAAGRAGGAYQAFARELAVRLAAHELTLEVRSTAGSVENVERLRAGEVDLAFVQGGLLGRRALTAGASGERRSTGPADDERALGSAGSAAATSTATPLVSDGLVSLGSLFHEPLWIVRRAGLPLATLGDLAGARVALGEPGSGTRPVAAALLLANGVGPERAEWLDWPPDQAVDGLLSGDVDALLLVASPRSPAVRRLMTASGRGVSLFDVERHLAYERLFPFLAHVVLARGQLDLPGDVPDHDVDLLAPVATLVARETLHPALIPLLIEAAEEVFGGADLFSGPGEFPSPQRVDAPLSVHARRVYESGPSLLYQWLPFRLAATLGRLKVMLLPLLTLLFPLLKLAPPVYRWRIRSKIYRWYRRLRELEDRAEIAEAAGDEQQRAGVAAELARVEKEVAAVSVPASYMDEFYNLRMHLERMRSQLGEDG